MENKTGDLDRNYLQQGYPTRLFTKHATLAHIAHQPDEQCGLDAGFPLAENIIQHAYYSCKQSMLYSLKINNI